MEDVLATPVYVVGDSTTLVFRDRVSRSASGASYVTRTMYCPHLKASTFSDAAGIPHAEMLGVLQTECLLVDEEGPPVAHHRAKSPHWRNVARLSRRPRSAPQLTFSFGGLDVPAIASTFGADVDFDLPDEWSALPAVPGAVRRLSTDAVLDAVRTLFRPVESGVQTLQRWGFDSLLFHSLPPTQRTGEPHYHWFFSGYVPVELRAKFIAASNYVLREICVRNGIPFLDAWPLISDDGVLRREFSLDAFHYNALASAKVTRRAIEIFEQQQQESGSRYLGALVLDGDSGNLRRR